MTDPDAMEHTKHFMISQIDKFGRTHAQFVCYAPPDAWCKVNYLLPEDLDEGEVMPEHPDDCYFTVLASGFLTMSIYDGPPTELRRGDVVFTKIGWDACTWHYQGDTGGHDYTNVQP